MFSQQESVTSFRSTESGRSSFRALLEDVRTRAGPARVYACGVLVAPDIVLGIPAHEGCEETSVRL